MKLDWRCWPVEGRTGRCTQGEYQGWYIFMVAEPSLREVSTIAWYVSLCSPLDSSQNGWADFDLSEDLAISYLESLSVRWCPPAEDERIEAEHFGLRDQYRKDGILIRHDDGTWSRSDRPLKRLKAKWSYRWLRRSGRR